MADKYIYTGPLNKSCPVCNKRFKDGPPVIYFLGGVKHKEHRWCPTCFTSLHREIVLGGRNEKDISQLLLATLGRHLPEDHRVSGYWFATVPNQGLTLIMEVVYDWE